MTHKSKYLCNDSFEYINAKLEKDHFCTFETAREEMISVHSAIGEERFMRYLYQIPANTILGDSSYPIAIYALSYMHDNFDALCPLMQNSDHCTGVYELLSRCAVFLSTNMQRSVHEDEWNHFSGILMNTLIKFKGFNYSVTDQQKRNVDYIHIIIYNCYSHCESEISAERLEQMMRILFGLVVMKRDVIKNDVHIHNGLMMKVMRLLEQLRTNSDKIIRSDEHAGNSIIEKCIVYIFNSVVNVQHMSRMLSHMYNVKENDTVLRALFDCMSSSLEYQPSAFTSLVTIEGCEKFSEIVLGNLRTFYYDHNEGLGLNLSMSVIPVIWSLIYRSKFGTAWLNLYNSEYIGYLVGLMLQNVDWFDTCNKSVASVAWMLFDAAGVIASTLVGRKEWLGDEIVWSVCNYIKLSIDSGASENVRKMMKHYYKGHRYENINWYSYIEKTYRNKNHVSRGLAVAIDGYIEALTASAE